MLRSLMVKKVSINTGRKLHVHKGAGVIANEDKGNVYKKAQSDDGEANMHQRARMPTDAGRS